MAKKSGEEITEVIKFTKEQIAQSKRYIDKQDALNAILQNDQSYLLSEVDELIDNFMKGKVN